MSSVIAHLITNDGEFELPSSTASLVSPKSSSGKVSEFIDPKKSIIASESAKNVAGGLADVSGANAAGDLSSGQEKLIKGFSHLGTAANIITAVGTLADIANNVMDNREAREMKNQQEKNQKEQMKREEKKRKRRRRRNPSHPLNTTGVVQEMFNQSIGHTSYGASRLPGQR